MPSRQAVIPARNEGSTVAGVVAETLIFVSEVIVVDDGSSDDTANQAREAGARVLTWPRSQGYLKALAAGLSVTSALVVVTLDADGEHDPEEIPKLVNPIELGQADLVFGTPGKPLRWSEGVLSRLASVRVPVRDSSGGYRAIRGDLARRLPMRGRCTCGLMALDAQRLGARLMQVQVQLRPVGKKRRTDCLHLVQGWWVLCGLIGR